MSTDVKSMHMGQITSFFIPNVTLVGENCCSEIPRRLKNIGGKRPLIVTDKGITACGILKHITDILDKARMKYVVYDGTVPNPTDKNVAEATEMYKENKCDSLITLGGGSSHDCGKGVGFVVSNGGTIHDYEGVDKSSKPFPPYVAVNTTAGTASEMTRFCIITDTSRKVKMAIVGLALHAQRGHRRSGPHDEHARFPDGGDGHGRPDPRHRSLCVHRGHAHDGRLCRKSHGIHQPLSAPLRGLRRQGQGSS